MDCLQVTETAYKEHHPEIFPSPFVTIKLRARARVKIWAVLKIQRLWRRALVNKRKRDEMAKKVLDISKVMFGLCLMGNMNYAFNG